MSIMPLPSLVLLSFATIKQNHGAQSDNNVEMKRPVQVSGESGHGRMARLTRRLHQARQKLTALFQEYRKLVDTAR